MELSGGSYPGPPMRAPRLNTQMVDLAGFEAWLRSQLVGPAFSAVVVVVVQMIRALFEQNTELRARILGRRPKPPSERTGVVERQLSFAFAIPGNDVVPAPAGEASGASDRATTADGHDDEATKKKRPKPQPRKRLPSHLGSVDVCNDVPADQRHCDRCDTGMTPVGRRCVTTLELIPAQIILRRRWDETVACPSCDRIVCAKAPPSVLDGGLLGPVLVTEALCDKVLNGMPIERQARDFQRQGVPIAASTLGRSVAAVLALLVPVAKRVLVHIKDCKRVQLDATSLRVLDRKAALGVFRDTLWALIGDRRWVYFEALESGDADAVEALLAGAEAESFQCDGTSTLNFVEKKWRRRRPGCHAHARRKLVEAARGGDLRAMEALRLYARLFAIEKQATQEGLSPEARQQRREERSLPILDELRAWVLGLAPTVEPKSPLGQALTYLQRQWLRLSIFVFDGEVELTNNRSEREIRPWVSGQHAWLFVGDQAHAERWAAGFTLMQTALAHGVNPRAYLHAIIAKLIAGHSHTRLDELLPDAMLKAHPELADPLAKPRPAPPEAQGETSPRAA